jgi:hypothetical protein
MRQLVAATIFDHLYRTSLMKFPGFDTAKPSDIA